MCFYLPWIIALVLWLFLLRSLKKHDRRFNYSFGHSMAIEVSGTTVNQASLRRTSRKNSKTAQESGGKEASAPSLNEATLPKTSRKNSSTNSEKGVPLQNLKDDDTIVVDLPSTRCTSLRATTKRKVSYCRAANRKLSRRDTLNGGSLLMTNNSNTNKHASLSCDNRFLLITKQRSKNVNRITLTVVILCFTNLICR